jgi:DNA-binding protein HU-beta
MSKTTLGTFIVEAAAIVGAKPTTIADALLAAITAELKASDEFALPGFGTFTVRSTAARSGVNPKTGAKIAIAAGRTVRFKPSAMLREEIALANPAKPPAVKTASPAKQRKAAAPPAPAPAPAPAAQPKRRGRASAAGNGAQAAA